MLVFVPPWVAHRTGKSRKTPIYSLHVHPGGQRLATAGLVNIKIWNMDPIRSQAAEISDTTPKLLSTFSIHDGAILCVRWSPDGEYLASGSEDAKVVVWKLDGSKLRNMGFGDSGAAKNVESYRVVKILPGHESDVADLAWSSDRAYLASCGFDRKIVIWDGSSFEQVKRIDCHAGFVKGVTWDPAGKYLATQASKPRLSPKPSQTYVHSKEADTITSFWAVFERIVLPLLAPNTRAQSDDRSIKVFRTSDWEVETSITEPLASGASSSFFTRLSWGPDGSAIVATNGESGSVCVAPLIQRQEWKSDAFLVGHKAAVEVASFNPKLFRVGNLEQLTGSAVSICATGSQDNGIAIWSTAYPRALVNISELVEHSILDLSWTPDGYGLLGCSYDGMVVYVSFDAQELGETLAEQEIDKALSRFGKRGTRHANLVPESPMQLDLETQAKSASGSRIAALMGVDDAAFARAATAHAAGSTPAAAAASAVAAAADRTNGVGHAEMQGVEKTSLQSALAAAAASQTPAPTPAATQTVSVTKDGKKRIKPVFIQSTDDGAGNPFASPSVASAPTPATAAAFVQGTGASNGTPAGASATPIPAGGIPAFSIYAAGAESSGGQASTGAEVQPAAPASTLPPTKYVLPLVNTFEALPMLGVPEVRDVVHVEIAEPGTGARVGLECRNEKSASRLCLTRDQEQLWMLQLRSPVLLSTITPIFVAVACADASLHLFSFSGRRLLPSLTLASATSFLSGRDSSLLCIDGTGQMFVWNVAEQRQILGNVSVAPILQTDDGVEDVDVTITRVVFKPDGVPILTTSKDRSFTFHADMRVWVELANTGIRTSGFGTVPGRPGQQRRFPTTEMLEDMLVSAVAAASPHEYRHWLRQYAHKLVEENAVTKAKELCDELTGTGIGPAGKSAPWVPQVLGLPKRELFKELLPVLAQNRLFQRILTAAQAAPDQPAPMDL
ncbi:HIR complex subunit [Polyrhizophydium stewartii]|uniref:Protein HIR n=1 Tax=Polyrhizophydium stewartii TaxID=2732419 RepID=A0ABR4MZ95_9FUNG